MVWSLGLVNVWDVLECWQILLRLNTWQSRKTSTEPWSLLRAELGPVFFFFNKASPEVLVCGQVEQEHPINEYDIWYHLCHCHFNPNPWRRSACVMSDLHLQSFMYCLYVLLFCSGGTVVHSIDPSWSIYLNPLWWERSMTGKVMSWLMRAQTAYDLSFSTCFIIFQILGH